MRVDRSATVATGGSYASFASKQVSLGGHKYAGGTISCPSTYPKAISGQFATGSPAVFATDSYQAGKSGWHTVVTNTGNTAATIQIGTICSK